MNDGIDDPAKFKTRLTEGWIVKSDVNDLWYVVAPVASDNVTGVWVTTADDGTGTVVSADESTAAVSNWPDGTKAPKWQPVTGASLDIVKKAKGCAS